MDHNRSTMPDRARRQARRHAEAVRHFMNFAGVYLTIGTFFPLINIFSGISPYWFFWPMLPMTIPLVILGLAGLRPRAVR